MTQTVQSHAARAQELCFPSLSFTSCVVLFLQLLDISELDMVGAGREAKRRRKTLGDSYFPGVRTPVSGWRLTCSPVAETEAGEKAAKEEAVVENTTPDYAAGLVSAQVLSVVPTF